ncbi:MAG: AAA family ATPase [bacterium]|nr:AAA family ATPase [bacterium]
MARNLLILYSHADQQWKSLLKNHVDVLTKAGGYKIDVRFSSDEHIEPGDDWFNNLEPVLNRADLIVLIVSETFLDSPFMQSEKVKNRLRKKQKGGFPIFIVQPYKSGWKRYSWLKNLPVWPDGGQYLSDFSAYVVESVLNDLTEQIARKLKLDSKISEGILSFLELNQIGPVKKLVFEPASRLNIITGDSGYGKTLLLECAWWALSGIWAQTTALPRDGEHSGDSEIRYQLISKSKTLGEMESISYDHQKKKWPRISENKDGSGLVIYARIDGTFAVWDPVRSLIEPSAGFSEPLSPLIFNHGDVLEGIDEEGEAGERPLCNGLLRDWVSWQDTNRPDLKQLFKQLETILGTLSCSKQEPLVPGEPILMPSTTLNIPTLKYPYGIVPFNHAASSVRRIASLAYLVVWTWAEHKRACGTNRPTYNNMTVIIDEIESHLHPQWQRTILLSLLELAKLLDHELDIQFLITTHSPIALASLETRFDEDTDKLFHLELDNDQILLKEEPYMKRGRVDHWFTSEVFGLIHARSYEAEVAIQEAESLLLKDNPTKKEVLEVHKKLIRSLGDFDTFWSSWLYFAEKVTGERL